MTCGKSVQIQAYLVEGSIIVQCEKTGQGNDYLDAAQSRKEEELPYIET